MAVSPRQKLTFEIADGLTVEENIAAFVLKLKTVDKQLANVLTSSLANFSSDISVNQDELLDALYAATAPLPESDPDDDVATEGPDL